MQGKNTNHEKENNILLPFGSKVLFILLVFFFQSSFANFTVINHLAPDADKENLIHSDSTHFSTEIRGPAIIYISSGVEISDLDEVKNYEVVETISSEIKKTKPKKQSVLQIAKSQVEQKAKQKLTSKKDSSASDEYLSSSSEPETLFFFAGNFSKISVTVSQSNVKQIFISENYKTSLAFEESELASVDFKITDNLTTQNKPSFSVRPPPFLL